MGTNDCFAVQENVSGIQHFNYSTTEVWAVPSKYITSASTTFEVLPVKQNWKTNNYIHNFSTVNISSYNLFSQCWHEKAWTDINMLSERGLETQWHTTLVWMRSIKFWNSCSQWGCTERRCPVGVRALWGCSVRQSQAAPCWTKCVPAACLGTAWRGQKVLHKTGKEQQKEQDNN